MIFYTADLHFGHVNAIKYDGRPFKTVDEMNDQMIQRWNARVKDSDKVYILGDFSMHNTDLTKEILEQLHGKKYLIRGNHDDIDMRSLFDGFWDYKKINDNGRNIILSHYFMPSYEGVHKDSIMLHGHTHNSDAARIEENIKTMYKKQNMPCKAFNVGCMYFNYTPATLDEIIRFWKNKKE